MLRGAKAIVFIWLCFILGSGGCKSAAKATPIAQSPVPTWPIPLPTIMDRGLLYGEPCDPPCWEDITPGISSESDVIEALERLEEEGRIKSYARTSDTHYWALFPSGDTLNIGFVDGIVSILALGYNRLTFDYRVKQVIECFGEPEAYGGYSNFARDSCPCDDWDDSEIYNTYLDDAGYLLYPSRGVAVFVGIPNDYLGCVCPEMYASPIYYFSPVSLADIIQENDDSTPGILTWDKENIIQWHGYGPGY